MEVAKKLHTAIISADSRQIYRDIPIGTAAPSETDRAAVRHYFVGTLPLESYYSASQFEEEALNVINRLFTLNDYAVMCGGSMMYIDAVVSGLDELPTISKEVREKYANLYEEKGLEYLWELLENADKEYFHKVDKFNHKRIIHALEIIEQSGCTYTSLRTNIAKERPFRILEFAIDVPRDTLYQRINDRTDTMLSQGWVEEARNVFGKRHLNSLNTVGYKELFKHFDGEYTLEEAAEKIKRNTRVYAKKQLTWLKKRPQTRLIPSHLPVDEKLKNIIKAMDS